MVGDYIGISFVDGKAIPVFIVGSGPSASSAT